MDILVSNSLTPEEKARMEEVYRDCCRRAGPCAEPFLSGELNFDKNIPCFFQGLEDGRLAGFLVLFMPGAQEAEAAAFVRPDCQGRGCFSALYRRALEEVRRAGIPRVLFVVGDRGPRGRAVAEHYGARPDHGENRMFRDGGPAPAHPDLTCQKVGGPDGPPMDEVRRGFSFQAGDDFLQAALESPGRAAFLVRLGAQPIGGFMFSMGTPGTLFLHSVGIAPAHRGRGLGRQLMGLALEEAEKRGGEVVLDVDTANTPACRLYLGCGFATRYRTDYYALDL